MGRVPADIALLQSRRNDVLVIVAPFNEHMIADKGLAGYTAIHDGAVQWLREKSVPCVTPPELPSELYADASHPLTNGYELLAKSVFKAEVFQKWVRAELVGRSLGWGIPRGTIARCRRSGGRFFLRERFRSFSRQIMRLSDQRPSRTDPGMPRTGQTRSRNDPGLRLVGYCWSAFPRPRPILAEAAAVRGIYVYMC